MRILVVDGLQSRHDFFRGVYNSPDVIVVQAYSYEGAVLEIDSTPNSFNMMFLEHDLSFNTVMCDPKYTYEKTGSDLAVHIVRTVDPARCDDLVIYCNSMNTAGRDNMVKVLRGGGFSVVGTPFLSIKNT